MSFYISIANKKRVAMINCKIMGNDLRSATFLAGTGKIGAILGKIFSFRRILGRSLQFFPCVQEKKKKKKEKQYFSNHCHDSAIEQDLLGKLWLC